MNGEKKTVFLGGTCNGSKWRDTLIQKLQIKYVDPVVQEWNGEAQAWEEKAREESDYCLYVLTPLMEGFFSVAEAAFDAAKRPEKVVFCVLDNDQGKTWTPHQKKSARRTVEMLQEAGVRVCKDLTEVADVLNA